MVYIQRKELKSFTEVNAKHFCVKFSKESMLQERERERERSKDIHRERKVRYYEREMRAKDREREI